MAGGLIGRYKQTYAIVFLYKIYFGDNETQGYEENSK